MKTAIRRGGRIQLRLRPSSRRLHWPDRLSTPARDNSSSSPRRILTFEDRGNDRVAEINGKIESIKQFTLLNERAIQTVNERLSSDERLIGENSNRITRMEAIIDRLFPQGSSTPIRK